MDTSNQSPDEQQTTPSYEYAAERSSSQPRDESERRAETREMQSAGDNEAIRKGLIYPPPPSFYLQEEIIPRAQPLPASSFPPQGPFLPPTAEHVPFAGQGYLPGPQLAPYPQHPVAKKSYRWLWIVISAIIVLGLASCGLCAWIGYSVIGSPLRQELSIEEAGISLTQNYYQALQNQDYAQAYTYLSPQGNIKGLTQAQFTKQAQAADQQGGFVDSYTPGSPSIDNNALLNSTITTFTMPVSIQRAHTSYSALLTISKIGNQWKITDYDRI